MSSEGTCAVCPKDGCRREPGHKDPCGDPWATDTADPARIFREMFPSPGPLIDWRLFMSGEDLVTRGVVVREQREVRGVVR